MPDNQKIIKTYILACFLVIIMIFLSCGDTGQKDQNTLKGANSLDTVTIVLSKQQKATLRLIPEAKETTKNWNVYTSLTKNLDSLKNAKLTDLQRIIPRMAAIFENQEEAEKAKFNPTPDTLDTPAINARLLTVETQIKVIQNRITKTRPNGEHIGTEVTGLFDAFQDLNLQINQQFTKGIEEILKEFQEQINESKENTPEEPSTYTQLKRAG